MPPPPAGPELLLRVLVRPACMAELTEAEWDDVLALARTSHLIGRLAADAQACGGADRAPSRVRAQFGAATVLATHHARTARWELNGNRLRFSEVGGASGDKFVWDRTWIKTG